MSYRNIYKLVLWHHSIITILRLLNWDMYFKLYSNKSLLNVPAPVLPTTILTLSVRPILLRTPYRPCGKGVRGGVGWGRSWNVRFLKYGGRSYTTNAIDVVITTYSTAAAITALATTVATDDNNDNRDDTENHDSVTSSSSDNNNGNNKKNVIANSIIIAKTLLWALIPRQASITIQVQRAFCQTNQQVWLTSRLTGRNQWVSPKERWRALSTLGRPWPAFLPQPLPSFLHPPQALPVVLHIPL